MDIKNYDNALTTYRAEWERTHQRPKRSRPRLMDFAQFLMFLPIAIVGPCVSAFRTAALIMAHTAFQDQMLIMAETLGGTFLFEAAALVYQFERLRRKVGGKRKLPEIGTAWIIVGLVAAVGAVTVSNLVEIGVAALAQAGVIVPPVIPAIAIGLFIGGGIPVMTIIAGEIGGRFILEYQVEDRKLWQEHQAALRNWEEQFARSWDRVKRRRLVASDQPVTTSQTTLVTDQPALPGQPGATRKRSRSVRANVQTSDRTSDVLAGHLTAIQQAVTERQQMGTGNGTFRRSDVETWRGVSASQAKNILRYGEQHHVFEVESEDHLGYIYRLVS